MGAFRAVRQCAVLPALMALLLGQEAQAAAEQPTPLPNPLYAPSPLFDASPAARIYSAIGAAPGAQGSTLVTDWAAVQVDATVDAGPLGDKHRCLSQGGEDWRATFMEELAPYLAELGARLVRCDPLGRTDFIVTGDRCVIDWSNADRMVDALKSVGARPMFNFTTCPEPWRDGRGFPTNLVGWADLVEQTVRHYNVERGDGIVYWELWNEPNHNIGLEEYLALYRVTARAVKQADPTARVGGPAAAALNLEWIEALLRVCATEDVPLDFVSWHNYTIAPWEYPVEAAKIRGLIRKYFDRRIEIALTEWGVDWREIEFCDDEVSGAHILTSLFFMRNSEVDLPMFFEPRDGWDWKGPDRRFWHRWGILTNRLDRKAGFHMYAFWSRLGPATVPVSVDRRNVWCVAARDATGTRVLVWNYPKVINRPEILPRPTEHTGVTLHVRGLAPGGWSMKRYLVDGTHSNPYRDLQRALLERVEACVGAETEAVFRFALAPYAATLLEFQPTDDNRNADGRRRDIARARADVFELYGGLPVDVSVEIAGIDRPWLAHAMGLDGVQVEAALHDRGIVRLVPPMVRAPRYVYLDCTLAEAETRNGYADFHAVDLGFLLRPSLEVTPLARLVDVGGAGERALLPFALENHSPQPLPVVIEATPPHAWWTIDRVLCTVPPRDRVVVDLPVRTVPNPADDPQWAAGTYDVPVAVRLRTAQGLVPVDEHTIRVGVPGIAVYRSNLRVDGDLSDWEGVPEIRFRNQRHPDAIRSATDFDPRCYLAWSGRGLYIAADLVDDAFHAQAVGGELWRNDSICFGMDLSRDADGTSTYGADDFEWGVSRTPNGLESHKWHAAHGHGGPFRRLEFAIEAGEGRARYEIFVPWRELTKHRPREGHVMGLNLSLNDRDPNGGGTVDWGNPLVRAKNPAGLVPVVLVRDSDQTSR